MAQVTIERIDTQDGMEAEALAITFAEFPFTRADQVGAKVVDLYGVGAPSLVITSVPGADTTPVSMEFGDTAGDSAPELAHLRVPISLAPTLGSGPLDYVLKHGPAGTALVIDLPTV